MAALFDTQLRTTAMTGAFSPAPMHGSAARVVKVNAGTAHALVGGAPG